MRTTYREEVRKIKKSEGTGSGLNDVYIPKWRHFDECSFLENVIASNQVTLSNVVSSQVSQTFQDPSNHGFDELLDEETVANMDNNENQQQPKRKKSNTQWMETAALGLNELAKGAKAPPVQNDQWDVFGQDVANSLREIKDPELQRRVKFAIQAAIFQTTEQAKQQQQQTTPQSSSPYVCFNTFQETGTTYHTF